MNPQAQPHQKAADLTQWREWLQHHRDDPEVIAGCARLGKTLAGGDAA